MKENAVTVGENARSVYLEVCGKIAIPFVDLGFRYAKSGPKLTKQYEDMSFRIAFQSSHYNVSGRHVQLWIHATIHSKKVLELRSRHLPEQRCTDGVAGGMIIGSTTLRL